MTFNSLKKTIMEVANYKDWFNTKKITESKYRELLLDDINKMSVFSERLVFHREDVYIVWEDTKRTKYYFIIDHEDDLNGKRLKYVGDIEYYKKERFLEETQKKINDIGKRDGYGRPKISIEEIKTFCQDMFEMVKKTMK